MRVYVIEHLRRGGAPVSPSFDSDLIAVVSTDEAKQKVLDAWKDVTMRSHSHLRVRVIELDALNLAPPPER